MPFGDGEEETETEIAKAIAKKQRKYMNKLHPQCCNDNCGCPKAPVHKNITNFNQFRCIFEDELQLQMATV